MNSIAGSETDSAVGFAIENKGHFACVVVESVGSALLGTDRSADTLLRSGIG